MAFSAFFFFASTRGRRLRMVLVGQVVVVSFFVMLRQFRHHFAALSAVRLQEQLLTQVLLATTLEAKDTTGSEGRSIASNHNSSDNSSLSLLGFTVKHTTMDETLPSAIANATKSRLWNVSKQHPVILFRAGLISVEELPKIPIVAWPYVEIGPQSPESLHIEENGIVESRYLELSNNLSNYDPYVVWVADVGFGPGPPCAKLGDAAGASQEKRRTLGQPLQWPVFVLDFTDHGENPPCNRLEKVVGRDMVWYYRRSIVRGRRWAEKAEWVETGLIKGHRDRGITFRHTPLVARTDTVRALRDVLATKYGMKLSDNIERLADRNRTDVSFFWPRDGKTGVGHGEMALLRHKVADVISAMGTTDGINVFVGLAGNAIRAGRRGVKSAYIEQMLHSKIVVVVQRDEWEDHYRLFEAVLSGAMVMTDRMLSLPPGLENGTSIVEFTSAHDLQAKILYYLRHDAVRQEIARRGRLVTMERHRAWHRIEEVIFGRPLSTCAGAKSRSPCPWIVHANDSLR